MNYLFFLGLALHFSHQISAEIDCTSLSCPSGETCSSYRFICESTTGCEWNTTDTFCESNDGIWQQSCCYKSVTAHPSQSPLQNPTESPSQNPTGRPSDSPSRAPTNSSSDSSEPSRRPTMQSAVKWEMIHPAYDGGDGELLWHVYYGDFSKDERFDDYRKKQMWHVQELKTIMDSDEKLRYEMGKNKIYAKSDAVLGSGTETGGTASKTGFGGWLILVAMLAICMFGFWYKCKSSSSTILNYNGYESKPLLNEKTVSDEAYQAIYKI